MVHGRRARKGRYRGGRYDGRRGDQPGLCECARRWWPLVAGSLALSAVLLGTYLVVPDRSGAAAEPHSKPLREPARSTADEATPQMRALGVTGRISSYTTEFAPGEPRVRNIDLAARALDGQVVQPGRAFSFNRVVGARTKARGYVPAPSIVGERLVNDVGGGICQVSTTLFNAVFQAGLQIRKSRAHTLWMPEYPEGREAAVAYPHLDLTWRNDSRRPVVVTTDVSESALTVTLWGERRYDVRAVSSRRYGFTSYTSVSEHGSSCVPMRGGRGFQVDVWRVLAQGGREVRRERFHTEYDPQNRVTCA